MILLILLVNDEFLSSARPLISLALLFSHKWLPGYNRRVKDMHATGILLWGRNFQGPPLGRLPSQPWEPGQPAGLGFDQWLSAFKIIWEKKKKIPVPGTPLPPSRDSDLVDLGRGS